MTMSAPDRTDTADSDTVETLLARRGIAVADADLPFLRRTLARQRAVLADWAARVPADTEPALVLRVLPPHGEADASSRRDAPTDVGLLAASGAARLTDQKHLNDV